MTSTSSVSLEGEPGSQQTLASHTSALFNQSVFSDVKIKQTHKGVTKEYHAHKAILSNNSRWFHNAFTGNFTEAKAGVVELHDDDPASFEIFLKLLYGKPLDLKEKRQAAKAIVLLHVYAVAVKYEASIVGERVAAEVKSLDPFKNIRYEYPEQKTGNLIEQHYDGCSERDGLMGRTLCELLVKNKDLFIRELECEKMAFKYPNFAADMFAACRCGKYDFK